MGINLLKAAYGRECLCGQVYRRNRHASAGPADALAASPSRRRFSAWAALRRAMVDANLPLPASAGADGGAEGRCGMDAEGTGSAAVSDGCFNPSASALGEGGSCDGDGGDGSLAPPFAFFPFFSAFRCCFSLRRRSSSAILSS
ncbi:hypothetical protein B0T18DRAFT_396032 [Schizothecium vesticola]|uniref:Uncharacterized protein n=1 Tax=Schizothecium vesticola TaxID=314040 RepID=A0AA40KBW8_9PEZI|nr:hypothetical protein B0T18DRAFT_396032 [Schizothecium vesticola]